MRLGFLGTPDPHHRLYENIDGDDIGSPNLSLFGWETKPVGSYFIVLSYLFDLFMLDKFN